MRSRLQTPFVPGGSGELDPLEFLDSYAAAMIPRFGPILLPEQGGYALSRDGRVLVMSVAPRAASSDIRFAYEATRGLESAAKRELRRDNRPFHELVYASFAGSHVDATRALQYMQRDLRYILVFGILLVLLLFVMVFRKVEAIYYVFLPVVFAIDWTLGLAGLLFEQITVATLIFVFVTIAIGFEFCLHIYNRFIHELYRSRNYPRSLEIAFVHTGRGIATSALTGAAIFASLSLTSSIAGLRQLGLVAFLGVLCGMAASLLVLPTMLAFKARLRKGQVRPVTLPTLGLDYVARLIAGYPRATLAAALLMTAYFAYWAHLLEFRKTPPPSAPPETANLDDNYFRDYPEGLPSPKHPLLALIESEDLEDALRRNDLLYANLRGLREPYRIISFESLRRVLPSRQTQSEIRQWLNSIDSQALAAALEEAGRRQGYSKDAFTPLLAALGSALSLPPDQYFIEYNFDGEADPAYRNVVQRYLRRNPPEGSLKPDSKAAPVYSIVTAIYPSSLSFASEGRLREFLIRAGAGVQGVRFTGDDVMASELAPGVQREIARTALLAALIVFISLSLHFHSAKKAAWVLASVAFFMIWTIGAMSLAGIHLHFYSMILMPLLAIFAIDHALHFLQFYDERRGMWPSLAVVGRAMLTTSLAIMVGLGGLAFARYEGFRHMGLTLLFGNLFAFLAAATLLPAAMRLRELGKSWLGVIGVDEGLDSDLNDS
ncbi:MAG: MMPL family protein [candidate division BRC1 bacterium ADurb.BinA364]|nr:MAG: MMPL family protein [candidate division BRC1 bacterium ADurb.BinA364]